MKPYVIGCPTLGRTPSCPLHCTVREPTMPLYTVQDLPMPLNSMQKEPRELQRGGPKSCHVHALSPHPILEVPYTEELYTADAASLDNRAT